MTKTPLMSVVIPSYHEAKGLAATVGAIAIHAEPLCAIEYILVDDGSTDETWAAIQQIAHNRTTVRGLRLSRNFGKESAINAGLEAARGDVVVTIDADLQHPPDLIPEMFALWCRGAKVVNTVKRVRQTEGPLKAWLTRRYFAVFRLLAGLDVGNAADFKLLDREVVDCLIALPERQRFYRGLVAWVGFEQQTLHFDVGPRAVGQGKWTLFKLIRLAMDSIVSFSTTPMHLMTILGTGFGLMGLALALRTLFLWLAGTAVPGFTTVILLLIIVASILMVGLGIIGVYIAKIYDEVKHRPDFIVREKTHDPVAHLDTGTGRTAQFVPEVRSVQQHVQEAGR